MERYHPFRVGRVTKEQMMLAVLATLTFLVVMWLCATIVAATLERNGSKIIAALQGRSPLATPSIAPVRLRVSQRHPSMRRPMQAPAGLRAAA